MTGPITIVTFDPRSPQAAAISALFEHTLVICGVIGALVTGLVGYCVLRFRAKPGDPLPIQVQGNTKLELLWTLIPLAIVGWIFALTLRAAAASDPPAEGDPDLVVMAHQWWWEIRYPSGAVTANEIHIPAGKRLLVRVESADVIHDFWVPQLARKIDAIPGRPNFVSLQANAPGRYEGTCAEFCGAQHAWMRLVVIAEPPADFEAWLRRQAEPAAAPRSEQARSGARLFAEKTCVACHTIAGSASPPVRVAPDLTHLATRETLGAGVLENRPDELARWLKHPQAVKPGCHMPDFRLSDREVADLVAYLEELQ
ncbi:MAG: cytochrome c oxidase subunit II [Myxococcales bacterium]|nr:cytochrome c oxidase subunit II [Myxococcales bacterium]